MLTKQDSITGLWCREDGAVLMPPSSKFSNFKKFRWSFGSRQPTGYRLIQYKGKGHLVHRLVCRAFCGLPPEDKPFVDHINRVKDDNRPSNLRWVNAKENQDNQDSVDRGLMVYGVRACEDQKGYNAAYGEANRDKIKAQQAGYRAEKKEQGLTKRRGPDGRFGWYPRIRA